MSFLHSFYQNLQKRTDRSLQIGFYPRLETPTGRREVPRLHAVDPVGTRGAIFGGVSMEVVLHIEELVGGFKHFLFSILYMG